MVELIPLNPDNPEHQDAIRKIWNESKDTLWDDRKRNVIVQFARVSNLINLKNPTHFLVEHDGEFVGYIGALVDDYDMAYLEGAALKSTQKTNIVRIATIKFCRYLFKELKVFKVKAEIPNLFKGRKTPAEKLCLSIGFKKQGIDTKAGLYNGRRVDLVCLYLFREGLRHE